MLDGAGICLSELGETLDVRNEGNAVVVSTAVHESPLELRTFCECWDLSAAQVATFFKNERARKKKALQLPAG